MFVISGVLGLLLFLLGIKFMSSNFKGLVSNKFKYKIDKFTSNKILSVFSGIIITSILHSSSATTLIVVGLVHSNMLSLYNAVPIIMGANIGTTITSQLVAFNFNIPIEIILFVGVFLFIIFRKTKFNIISKLIISVSLIFLGLDMISSAITPLKGSETFFNFIAFISKNKLLSFTGGILLTAIIQSSTTGIAILQVMASSSIVSVKSAIPIILGQNVGTCLDTVIGSLATNKSGKQAALVQVLFNLSGALTFIFLTNYIYDAVTYLSPDNISRQIANAHTLFNVLSTILLLPFSNVIADISKKIIR